MKTIIKTLNVIRISLAKSLNYLVRLAMCIFVIESKENKMLMLSAHPLAAHLRKMFRKEILAGREIILSSYCWGYDFLHDIGSFEKYLADIKEEGSSSSAIGIRVTITMVEGIDDGYAAEIWIRNGDFGSLLDDHDVRDIQGKKVCERLENSPETLEAREVKALKAVFLIAKYAGFNTPKVNDLLNKLANCQK